MLLLNKYRDARTTSCAVTRSINRTVTEETLRARSAAYAASRTGLTRPSNFKPFKLRCIRDIATKHTLYKRNHCEDNQKHNKCGT